MRNVIVLVVAVLFCSSVSSLHAQTETDSKASVLLITSKKLAGSWKEFADWKTSIGKLTEIVTIESIGSKYKGRDLQEKIKACCLSYIKSGTKWVILGGDSQPRGGGNVPDRDTKQEGPLFYADMPTDVYYISEKNWDADGNGVFGQWSKDRKNVSYTNKDVSIGRIPVRTASEVADYTKKVIEYETAYPDKGFATNMIQTCPVRNAYPKLGTAQKLIQSCLGDGKIEQYFASKTPWDSDRAGDYPLSPDNFVKMINSNKVGKIHVHGHGFLKLWVLESHKNLVGSHVAKMKNSCAYPVMTTVSCFTGQFDGKEDPSITEAMIRKPGGGAIAIVAPAREGCPVFHSRSDYALMMSEGKMDGTTELLTKFWVNGLKGSLSIGEALAVAKSQMVEHAQKTCGYHMVLCELNLLGDPTLDMRSKDPVTPVIKCSKTIKPGKQKVDIETSAPGCTICVSGQAGVYHVAKADASGKASIEIAPKAGELLITASGANVNVVSTKVSVK